ncbi:MAG: hypothetical protein ACTSO9_20525 [Candidatus Helarchaeota archaeon]
MVIDFKLQNSVKAFATEAGRFKLQDLAEILGIEEKKVWDVLVNLLSIGEIEGTFANNNSEFVIKNKLKQEILTILDNPNLINSNIKKEKNHLLFSSFSNVKKCPKCKISVNIEGNFCPNCGQSLG